MTLYPTRATKQLRLAVRARRSAAAWLLVTLALCAAGWTGLLTIDRDPASQWSVFFRVSVAIATTAFVPAAFADWRVACIRVGAARAAGRAGGG